MTDMLKARTILAAVAVPVCIAVIAVMLVGDSDPALQKLTVGGSATGREAQGQPATADSVSSASGLMYAPANYVLAGDLPDLPDRAPAYRYRAQDGVATASRVAAALGLTGEVRRNEQTWEVRDGQRILVINDSPTLSWFLSECFVHPESAQGEGSPEQDYFAGCGTGGVIGIASDLAPPTGDEPVRPAGLPDREEARKIATATFERLGLSTQGLQVEDGFSSWYVWSPMRVGDVEVQMTTSLMVGVDGRLVGGNGIAGIPESLGEYPLVSVKAGFERLQQGRFVAGGGIDGGGMTSTHITKRVATIGAVPIPGEAPALPEITDPAPPQVSIPPIPPFPPATSVASATSVPSAPDLKAQIDELLKRQSELCAEGKPCQMPPSDIAPLLPAPDGPPPTVTVTGARIVLVLVGDTLVPAYVFEVGQEFGGVTPPVPAVVEDLLDTAG